MSNSVIKVDNLSKRYRIGAIEEGYKTIRETIVDGLSAPLKNWGRLRSLTRFKNGDEEDVIWALRDVSFEVDEGEVLGIIGKNGAGKTTILKILSRITEPTDGLVEIHGRVSSLLEVGTGFHPELTGRENIFLNGAILGMRKREIESKFDDIVNFAEVEKYIDTPIKRYSSGMQVRLAFSVAAHLEPEILLVDEVLAVGDIAFQKKCLGKMGDVARLGRTILFISHNMSAIRNLCEKVIWLDSGQIVEIGATDKVVRDYEENQLKRFDEFSYVAERDPEEVKDRSFYISRVEMQNTKGENTNIFSYNDSLVLLVDMAGEPKDSYSLEFRIWTERGHFMTAGASGPFHGVYFDKKTERVRIDIGPLILSKGRYTVSLSLVTGTTRADNWDNACSFHIVECQPFATGRDVNAAGCVLQHSFSKEE
ncbi:ABC transporter ATP-binding protein [Chloroflexota bacterium]